MTELLRRLRYLLNRRRYDEELAGDMEFHREMAAREPGGQRFGNPLLLREEAREAWGWAWIDRLSQDLRYAARMLRKSPGFTLAAVLMLALGIAVNVTAFGFFNFIVLKPLPVRDPASLLRFERRGPDRYWSDMPYAEMTFFRDRAKTLSAVIGVKGALLSIEGEPKPVHASFVTGNYFTELGGPPPIAGRLLDPSHDSANDAAPVAVISQEFWQRHFDSDPSIAGKTIRLNGKPALIAGVFSTQFSGLGLNHQDVLLPLNQQPYFVTGSQLLREFPGSQDRDGISVWGRLQPGLSAPAAENELRALAQALRRQYPNDIWENEQLPSEPGGFVSAAMHGTSRGSGSPKSRNTELYQLGALAGALGLLILAAACGNLGSLLLARGVAREREIAIRVAVGAGSARLARQLFTESLLLAALGSACGLVLGNVLLRGCMAITQVPAWVDASPDWRVFAFSIAIAFVSAILFGLTPALQLARRRHRATVLRQWLIGSQVAASCVLLIVAGLLARALDQAMAAHPGFDFQQVVSIDPALDAHGYSPAKAAAYLDAIQQRLRGAGGVQSVSIASTAPLGHKTTVYGETIDGIQLDVHVNHVGPEYFATMKIPLLAGHNFAAAGDPRGIIVSQSMARRRWPGQDPLGKEMPFDADKFTVIGIAGNAPLTAPQDPDAVECYFLAGAADMPSMTVLVKLSAGPAEGLVPVIVSLAKEVDPKIFPEVQPLQNLFREKIQGAERSALFVGLLGFTALLLACLGIVGLVAYAVSQRSREIGLRMALGARPAHILSVVLMQFSRPVCLGLLVGAGGAAGLSQLLRRNLYGVNSLDPLAYLGAITLFVVIALSAALVPARSALRIDPLRALRLE